MNEHLVSKQLYPVFDFKRLKKLFVTDIKLNWKRSHDH